MAIDAFAKRNGFTVVQEFYDAAVSGADPIQDRPGFASLLDRIEDNGVRTVIVEDASRFARELMAQEFERKSLRKISEELQAAGFLNERGKPYNPNSIKVMLEE